MRRFAFVLVAASIACSESQPPAPPPREAIAIEYVSSNELPIHASPSTAAPVVTTYKFGEAVSILSKKGTWSEVRIDFERSGWAEAERLSASEGEKVTSTPESIRFLRAPAPVSNASNIRGEIVLEASVGPNGEVSSVRTVSNSTGSKDLELKNTNELKQARFAPLTVRGVGKPFVYEYRVSY